MDQHFNLEYFTAFIGNEFELCISYIKVRQEHGYNKIFINVKFLRKKVSLSPECLSVASVIIHEDIKSIERLGLVFGNASYPYVMQLIDEGYLKLRVPKEDFEKLYFRGAHHAGQKIGHA